MRKIRVLLETNDPIRADIVKMHKAMFTLVRPDLLPRTALYHDLAMPPIKQVRDQLLAYQQEHFGQLVANGLCN